MSLMARKIIPIIAHFRRKFRSTVIVGSVVVCNEQFLQASVTDEELNQMTVCNESFLQTSVLSEEFSQTEVCNETFAKGTPIEGKFI